jgi:hypothetical protein
MSRHGDFERIKREFETYYCKGREGPCPKGEREYYVWLNALQLDETLPYGQARESFSWKRENIHYVREDPDNKYYEVLVGFPIESMNRNVYHETDLIAAAMSLKGANPSLNHKDEFWFSTENPNNKWGVLTVTGGKYEDGAVEVMLKVPKAAVCPVCNGRKMVDLIDEHRIVNVSLEGGCKLTYDAPGGAHECVGFEFNKKGFSLLTSDILPGIPMARIFPMEAYLPFSEARHKRVKIVGLEKMNTTKEGEISGNIKEPEAPQGTEPDAKGQCPEGQHFSGDLGKCVPNEPEPPTQTHTPEGTDVVQGTPAAPDNSMKPHPESLVDDVGEPCSPELQACVDALIAKGTPASSAWPICKSKLGEKGPDRLITSKHAMEVSAALAAKQKAENERDSLKRKLEAEVSDLKLTVATNWDLYLKEQNARIKLEGRLEELIKTNDGQGVRLSEWTKDRQELELRLKKRERDLTESLDDVVATKKLLEDTRKELQDVTSKYREALTTNMQLNKRITQQNEDWLTTEKAKEDLEERLKRAKRLGKTISVKI